jgi:hypothetical protein
MFKCKLLLVIFGIDDDYESWVLLKDGKIPSIDQTDDRLVMINVKQLFEDIVKYNANFTTISLVDVDILEDVIYISYQATIPKDTLPTGTWIKSNEATMEQYDHSNKTVLSLQDYSALYSAIHKRKYSHLTTNREAAASAV